ncbi:MAG TPA: MBL fold metallo-hydrolase [Candidatus Lokiarchaeia archaeon]|nr:MBL fold metallo-hydrolase [Candidatus Lokiarchaeia archaeon]
MEIVPGIHWIQGIIGNVYVHGDAELTLIDTGMAKNAKKILKYIETTMHRLLADVKTIVITHADMDHVGNLAAMKNVTGAIVTSHSIEAEYVAGRRIKSTAKLPFLLKLMRPLMKGMMNFPRVEVDRTLEQDDIIGRLQVLFTPGHSPGSIALYDPVRKALFSGDTILTDRKGNVFGPRNRFTPDINQAWQSAESLKVLDVEVLLPGHGTPLTENVKEKLQALSKPGAK